MLARLSRHNNLPQWLTPTTVVLLLTTLLVVFVIAEAGGDPLALARIGPRYSEGEPSGEPGYDGQFVYYIARNPDPREVAPYLDVPAYRYQRILLPILARCLSFGNVTVIPWVLAVLGILSQTAGTWAVERLLTAWGVSRWYALLYGLWAGLLLAVIVDLPEPLAYGLVAGAFLALRQGKRLLVWVLLCLSVFAKEVTILFVVALVLADASQRRWRSALGLGLFVGIPFGLFQLWLWQVFGQPGIGSGGDMATPFEWIPFMGLWRIGFYSLAYLLAMSLVFVPMIVLPSLWGMWKSVRIWLTGQRNMVVLALFLNCLIIPFMPFSTFREPGGILRFACGMVLAIVLFASRYGQRRELNYCFLWMVLIVFLLK